MKRPSTITIVVLEVLAVLVIFVCIPVSIKDPASPRLREISNVREVASAVFEYAADHRMRLPDSLESIHLANSNLNMNSFRLVLHGKMTDYPNASTTVMIISTNVFAGNIHAVGYLDAHADLIHLDDGK